MFQIAKTAFLRSIPNLGTDLIGVAALGVTFFGVLHLPQFL
ncbi:MAG: hypothetical protein ACPGNV_08185 [Mangrovicoccus sp.]